MSLKSIKPDVSDNLQGLQAIYFIPVPFVNNIPAAVDNVISNDISLASGKKWLSLYVTLNSADYNEEKQRNEHGVFYEKELTGFLPKDSPGIAAQLEEMENYRFHVIYKDRNDHYKLVQDLEFTHEFSTDGRNGFDITFEGSGVKPAYFYEGFFEIENATIKTDQVSKTIHFTWPEASVLSQSLDITTLQKDIYDTVETEGDVDSYTLKKNGSAVSTPFQLEPGDELTVEITKADFANSATLTLISNE